MSQKGNMENREVLELWGSQKKNVKRKMRDISCEQEKTSPKKTFSFGVPNNGNLKCKIMKNGLSQIF